MECANAFFAAASGVTAAKYAAQEYRLTQDSVQSGAANQKFSWTITLTVALHLVIQVAAKVVEELVAVREWYVVLQLGWRITQEKSLRWEVIRNSEMIVCLV